MKMTLEQVQQAALELDDMFLAWHNDPFDNSDGCWDWFCEAECTIYMRFLHV